MNLFINDVYVRIAKPGEFHAPDRFNNIVDCSNERLTRANLIHHALVKNPQNADIDTMLNVLNHLNTPNIYSVTLIGEDNAGIKDYLKSRFNILKAAGGVVVKGTKVLMIHRMNKWDLPKGKIDRRESTRTAALREVEEECNIKARITGKICNTWHTYTLKKKPILKKTSWYSMKVVDDTGMKPQVEEQIDELKWMSPKQMFHALDDSYQSIRFVLREFKAAAAK